MYCSICGNPTGGRSRCDNCGASTASRAEMIRAEGREMPQFHSTNAPELVRSCPRCAYRGEGLPYFSRGAHMAALVGSTILTAGAMGVGGLVYYLVRRDHRVCPRCGRGWGHRGQMALVRAGSEGSPVVPRRTREGQQRAFSVLFFLVAAAAAVLGVAQGLVPALMVAMAAAGAGYFLQRAANHEREQRRAALISSLQLPVLKLAAARGGRLTVTEVAAELEWTLPRAEKVLQSLDDGYRVSSEVTDEGLIVYEFRELFFAQDRQLPPEPTD